MPIKPENKDRYPANWKTEIRPAILKRAGNKCEWCGKPNRKIIKSVRVGGSWIWWDNDAAGWRNEKGDYFSDLYYDENYFERIGNPSVCEAEIVLTIAHLDHIPENCDPSNLRALCQRCHLTYDRGKGTAPEAIKDDPFKPAAKQLADWWDDEIFKEMKEKGE